MAWTLELTKQAKADLDQVGATAAQPILKFLYERVRMLPNPRMAGKSLSGNAFAGLWRYRVGEYRILCEIQDAKITILAVHIGQRRVVYR